MKGDIPCCVASLLSSPPRSCSPRPPRRKRGSMWPSEPTSTWWTSTRTCWVPASRRRTRGGVQRRRDGHRRAGQPGHLHQDQGPAGCRTEELGHRRGPGEHDHGVPDGQGRAAVQVRAASRRPSWSRAPRRRGPSVSRWTATSCRCSTTRSPSPTTRRSPSPPRDSRNWSPG